MTDPQEASVTDLATQPNTKPRSEIRAELTIDTELLLEAQRQISAASPDDAVNEALRRLVDEERAKRDAARARLQQMYDGGELDFHPLEELDQ
jgi:Arc/MetJ family transcription regulator